MYCERVKISWLTRSPSDKYFMTFEPYKDFALCLVIVYLRTRTTKKFAQSEIKHIIEFNDLDFYLYPHPFQDRVCTSTPERVIPYLFGGSKEINLRCVINQQPRSLLDMKGILSHTVATHIRAVLFGGKLQNCGSPYVPSQAGGKWINHTFIIILPILCVKG